MKLSTLLVALTCICVNAFAPQTLPWNLATTSSQLNLFGGGAKKDGETKKGPGMLDQLAMLKKAQEMAQKKNKLDQELAAMEFAGTSENGKVKATYKYIPSKNPMDPTPDYDAVSFDFDEEWYEGASLEELSAAVKEAVMSGVASVNKGVEEKYEVLKADIQGLAGVFGGDAAPPS